MTFAGIIQTLHLYHSRRDDGIEMRAEEETRLRQVVSLLPPTDAEWVVGHLGARPRPAFEVVLRLLVSQHAAVMDPLIAARQERFVSQVVNTLEYFIHRESEVEEAARGGADLYWMIERLRFLVKACFLAELGFPETKAVELFKRNALYQHVCTLAATKEAQGSSAEST
jgi:hypothetical protein